MSPWMTCSRSDQRRADGLVGVENGLLQPANYTCSPLQLEMPSVVRVQPSLLRRWVRPSKTKQDLPWADIAVIDMSKFDRPGGKQQLAEGLRHAVGFIFQCLMAASRAHDRIQDLMPFGNRYTRRVSSASSTPASRQKRCSASMTSAKVSLIFPLTRKTGRTTGATSPRATTLDTEA